MAEVTQIPNLLRVLFAAARGTLVFWMWLRYVKAIREGNQKRIGRRALVA